MGQAFEIGSLVSKPKETCWVYLGGDIQRHFDILSVLDTREAWCQWVGPLSETTPGGQTGEYMKARKVQTHLLAFVDSAWRTSGCFRADKARRNTDALTVPSGPSLVCPWVKLHVESKR